MVVQAPTERARPRLAAAVATGFALAVALTLAAPGSAAAKPPPDFFGVSVYAPTRHDFTKMANGEMGSVRTPISWRAVQKTRKGGFKWGGSDHRVRQIVEEKMAPKVLLFGTPRFIAKDRRKLKPPVKGKANRRAWFKFVRAAVNRYGKHGTFWNENPTLHEKPVTDWMIWNEQNAQAYWKPKASPRQYATLLRISDRALAAADPDADLIVGGMYGYSPNPRSMPAKRFLRRLYRKKGMRKRIDGVALHPYAGRIKGVRKQVRNARQVLRGAGDRNARLIIGELGWASAGDRSDPLVKTKKRQGKLIARAMRMFVKNRRRWRVDGVYVYLWRDYKESADSCSWCPSAGLVNRNGKGKPAWTRYKRVIRASRR